MADKIYGDIQTLTPGSRVQLYELDATHLGGDVVRFHSHRQSEPIWWQGKEYKAYPIDVEGLGMVGTEEQARPTLTVADLDSQITVLCALYKDLAKSRFTIKGTLVRFLDEVNFPEGNPEADPNEQFPDYVFYINQRTEQIPGQYVKFELRSALDLDGSYLPSRQIIKNVCQWKYRGPYCGYTGTAMFDKDDNPTTDPAKDMCSYTMRGCSVRYPGVPMPFGGFPATLLTRV